MVITSDDTHTHREYSSCTQRERHEKCIAADVSTDFDRFSSLLMKSHVITLKMFNFRVYDRLKFMQIDWNQWIFTKNRVFSRIVTRNEWESSKIHWKSNPCLSWFLNRLLIDLASIFGSQVGAKIHPKFVEKSIQQVIDFVIDFWDRSVIAFGCNLGATAHCRHSKNL